MVVCDCQWIVKLRNRGRSGTYNQNFIWNCGDVYVMDNHRAALWCWMQHYNGSDPVSIIHIDRHTDTLGSQLNVWMKYSDGIEKMTISEYLSCSYKVPNGEFPVFRYDNYLSIFLERYKEKIDKCVFATHLEGDKPNFVGYTQMNSEDLRFGLEKTFASSRSKWIVNLDVDYFYEDYSENEHRMCFEDQYVDDVFNEVCQLYASGSVCAITVALSPEFCGSWANAENLAVRLWDKLGLFWGLALEG